MMMIDDCLIVYACIHDDCLIDDDFVCAINLQKVVTFFLLDNYFSDLSTAIQIWYWKPFKLDLGRVFQKKNVFPAKIELFLTSWVVKKA